MIDFDKPRSATSQSAPATRAREATEAAFDFDEISLASETGNPRANRGARQVNDLFAVLIVVIVMLAAVPIASARPVFWMIWSGVLCGLLATYMLTMLNADPARNLESRKALAILGLGLALPTFALVQYFVGGPLSLENLPADLRAPVGSIAPGATLVAAVKLYGIAALFVLTFEVSTRAKRVRAMAWGIFAGTALHAIWALIALVFLGDFVFWGEKLSYNGVATGTFVNRNSFANFLGMGLAVGVAMILARGDRPHMRMPGGRSRLSERNLETMALWIVAAVVSVALVATQSRMGVVASFIAALAVYAVMMVKREHRVVATATRVSIVGLVAVFAVSGVFGQGVLERGLFASTASVTRVEIYKQVIGMIANRPLAGTGLGTFQPAYELVHQEPVATSLVWRLAHNTYLGLWSEVGLIVGTLPMIAIAIAAWKLVGIIMRRRTDYALPAAALSIIALQALHSTVDFSLEIQANLMLFVVIVAMGLGHLRRRGGG